VIAGWFTSPYSLSWLAVFRHNFGANILYRPPSAITELQPGFVTLLYPSPSPMSAIVAAMLMVPWLASQYTLSRRERVMAGLYWALGLVLFGYAVRLFLIWWLLAIVPAGWAIAQLTRRTDERPPRFALRILALAACVVILTAEVVRTREQWALEGDVVHRTLPSYGALPAERLAAWVDSNVATDAHARLMTSFTFGSYLTWRLPGYSASIDSRGTFPDSVSAAEAVVGAADRDVPLGPWRSADVAILPVRFRAAAALDTAAGWRRMATAPGDLVARDSAALWVSDAWWSRFKRGRAK
jgi:hypothetical protein